MCAFLTIVPPLTKCSSLARIRPVCRHTSSDRDVVSGASSLHSDGRDSNHLLPNHLWLQSTPAAAILRSFRMVLVHDVAAPAGCWNPSRSPPATDFRNTDTRRPWALQGLDSILPVRVACSTYTSQLSFHYFLLMLPGGSQPI